jgi:hypothetical protein
MPTFYAEERFWNEYADLSPGDQELFLEARDEFVKSLKAWESQGCQGIPQFPKKLGVRSLVRDKKRYMEFAWASDGRCTWEFGTPQRPGKCHVIWRRIGSHRIYGEP